MNDALYEIEDLILERVEGRFVNLDDKKKLDLVVAVARGVDPNISKKEIDEIFADIQLLHPIDQLVSSDEIEDVMVNNVNNIFIYHSKKGYIDTGLKIDNIIELNRLVAKLKLYATNETAKGNILDVHLQTKSRVNIVSSPRGYDITIRNFKQVPLSMIDLINSEVLTYKIAARLWLYIDGLKVRPANIMIGGIPGAGKTTLLNAFLSFFRPDARIVTIEETYELDTSTMPNSVNLETSIDMPLEALVENSLRMRPETIIVGEVRGPEANDMIAAMTVGKRGISTIHASSTRDIIDRLIHAPMNVPKDMVSVIDALVVAAPVYIDKRPQRRIVQISEIAGMETQTLLSDLYKIDYKTHKESELLSSVTYRDKLAALLNIPPTDILAEEKVRAQMLEQMNKIGKRDIGSMGEIIRDYYDTPDATLKKIGLLGTTSVIDV